MSDRLLLALQQPATWYAIATGAGVFGIPIAWLLSRRTTASDYRRGYRDGQKDARQ